jgi:hydroxyacylglutathione hydrolase
MKIIPVPQLMDNYAYLVIDEGSRQAGIVDCAEAEPVLEAVKRAGVRLTAVLPTHHHYDHVGGNEELLAALPDLTVYGVDERIPGLTTRVRDGEGVQLGGLAAQVIFIPAHTTGHIAYYFPRQQAVFTGDTLFAGGCGRLFEGDAAMMIRVPVQAQRVAGRDARLLRPRVHREEPPLRADAGAAQTQRCRKSTRGRRRRRARAATTTPTTIGSEKATNPFLRWDSTELRQSLKARFPTLPMDDVSVFAKTRALKDEF